ncbi:hypothetical protein, partial [Escherichia coli]|uniref:hypothetical protein n=1 Tax=Escherichia coli TaxID=562 RepID=UPI003D8A2301
CVVRRLRFSGPKTSIICSPMTSLKTSIKTITYLSDIGCLEIQGASLIGEGTPDLQEGGLCSLIFLMPPRAGVA